MEDGIQKCPSFTALGFRVTEHSSHAQGVSQGSLEAAEGHLADLNQEIKASDSWQRAATTVTRKGSG